MVIPAPPPRQQEGPQGEGSTRLPLQGLASEAGFSQLLPLSGTHPASAGQRPASRRAQGASHPGGRPLSPSPLGQRPLRGSHEATRPIPPAFPLCCWYWGPGSLKLVTPIGPSATWGQALSLPSLLLTIPFPRAERST